MSSPHGFNFFLQDYIENLPQNWSIPFNYEAGQFYTRYEIVNQASNEPCGIQFGIWQWRSDPPEDEKDYSEQMAEIVSMSGPGSIVYNNSSPIEWWGSYDGVDFRRVGDFWRLGINIWSLDPRSVISSKSWGGSDAVWNNRDIWFPISVNATVIAVAEGYTFSGWENYEDIITTTDIHLLETEVQKNDEITYPFKVHIDHTLGYLRLDFIQSSVSVCNIHNAQGQIVHSEHVSNDESSKEISLSRLGKGLYILHIIADAKQYNYKFICF